MVPKVFIIYKNNKKKIFSKLLYAVELLCGGDVSAVFPLYKGEQIKTFFMIYIFTLFNKYNFKEKSKLFFIYLSKYLFYVIWYKYIK